MMKKIIFLIIVLLLFTSFSPALAELKTFIKEYTYQAGEYDSKVTCRTLALEQVKRLLLEELGTYLVSETVVTNYQLSKDDIKVITAGVTQTKIIDEKWDGNSYWVKVEISSDPQELSKSIDRILGNAQLLKNLKIAKKKSDDAFKQIEQLRNQQKTIKSKSNKVAIKSTYQKEVNELSNSGEWLEDFKLLLEAGGDIDKGKYDSAILTAETIINKKGTDSSNLADAYLIIGIAYKQKGMFDEAIEALQKVSTIKLNSAFVPVSHEYLGRTYVDMKMYQKAISEFEKAISILNEGKKNVTKEGRSDYDRFGGLGSFQRQVDYYDECLADNLLGLAIAYLGRASQTKGADDDLKRIIVPKETTSAIKNILEIKPNSPSILVKVFYLTSEEDFSDLRAWCEKLLKRYPNNSKVYLVRGRTYIVEKNNQQAISDFSKVIELDPQNPEPYKFRGIAFSLIGNSEMSIKDFDKAIEMNPSEADLYNLRGHAYLQKIIIMKDGKPHFYPKDEEQAKQAFNDIMIAARLGDKDAQDYLRKLGKAW
jgi:tetratricopeptide (TPR) repeat protein